MLLKFFLENGIVGHNLKFVQIKALDSRRNIRDQADDTVYRFSPAIPVIPGVMAALAYLAPTAERPYNYMYEPPTGTARENCEYRMSPAWITVARAMASRKPDAARSIMS